MYRLLQGHIWFLYNTSYRLIYRLSTGLLTPLPPLFRTKECRSVWQVARLAKPASLTAPATAFSMMDSWT